MSEYNNCYSNQINTVLATEEIIKSVEQNRKS